MSHVARHTSHVTRHTSHVTRHTSHVTRHPPALGFTAKILIMQHSIGRQFFSRAATSALRSTISNCATSFNRPLVTACTNSWGNKRVTDGCVVGSTEARHMSQIVGHTSHVTRHTSHVTRHTSHVTRHTSHVTPAPCPCPKRTSPPSQPPHSRQYYDCSPRRTTCSPALQARLEATAGRCRCRTPSACSWGKIQRK